MCVKRVEVLVCGALVLWSACSALGQPVIFVNDDATGANNGSSWDDAYLAVQDAIALATSGDQVWVAAVSDSENNPQNGGFQRPRTGYNRH